MCFVVNITNPLFDGHKAGELRQDGVLFTQLYDERLQLDFLLLMKKGKKDTHQLNQSNNQIISIIILDLGPWHIQNAIWLPPCYAMWSELP